MTIIHKTEPQTLPVDREWVASMLADLDAGNLDECREILEAALKLFDREREP